MSWLLFTSRTPAPDT